jgi:hypothetical protein
MQAAGLGHVPFQMVDELERIWHHSFPPGYTQVRRRRRRPERASCRGGVGSDRFAAPFPPPTADINPQTDQHHTTQPPSSSPPTPPPRPQGAKFMAHMWEDLRVQYRPLAFYAAMEAAALLSWGAMRLMGFRAHRLG